VSIGVTFYTAHTVRTARVHQFNRICRKYLHMQPTYPGTSPTLDRAKAPFGLVAAVSRHWVLRALTAWRGIRTMRRPEEGWLGEKAPPGSY
jgi:hypothetical protein